MRNRVSVVMPFFLLLAAGIPAAVAAQSAPAADPESAAIAAKNDAATEKLLRQIAGKEEMPAEKVFKNVKVLRGMTAVRFVQAMNSGYSKSLGIACEHCHVAEDWAADEKRPKAAAREMIEFTRHLNGKLKTLENLDTNEPVVNCATCHRGSLEPATSVDGKH